jgi:RecA-family ATPase
MYGIKKAFDWVEAFEKRGLSWTIPTWVPEGAVVLLAGAAGSGKSFLGLQAALGLAGGGSAWGETVEPKGKVLYLGADTNPHMFGEREPVRQFGQRQLKHRQELLDGNS